jgi:hypothetical protein
MDFLDGMEIVGSCFVHVYVHVHLDDDAEGFFSFLFSLFNLPIDLYLCCKTLFYCTLLGNNWVFCMVYSFLSLPLSSLSFLALLLWVGRLEERGGGETKREGREEGRREKGGGARWKHVRRRRRMKMKTKTKTKTKTKIMMIPRLFYSLIIMSYRGVL